LDFLDYSAVNGYLNDFSMRDTDTKRPVEEDEHKDKAIRLFTFLREVTASRTKTVRTLDNYEQVLWIADIPQENECHFVGWNPIAETDSEDTWSEVKKPRMQSQPSLSSELGEWVNPHELKNSGNEPALFERILIDSDLEEQEEQVDLPKERMDDIETPQFRELTDHPQIQALGEEYLTHKWRPWAEIDRRKQKIHRLYTDLFTLYQQQNELGETYEIVVGLGQLRWRTSSGQEVNRHLIAAQTSLEFDSVRGVITVGPSTDGAKPGIEQDMLDPSDRPSVAIQTLVEDNVAALEDDIWHNESIHASLKSWAHSVADGSGEFIEGIQPLDSVSNTARIAWAPALILRKRTDRGLLQLYTHIIDDLKNRAHVPKGLRPLVDIDWQDHSEGETLRTTPSEDDCHFLETDRELYFPLPSNEKQREIVTRLNSQRGVLVQGPPGTGKSHSIANLVSHLLATGKRILVTSQTPRALRVLKEKIPGEISDLCIVLLGHDQSSFEELEGSVHGITQRLNTWDRNGELKKIKMLENELDSLRRNIAKTESDLRSIREAETRLHPPINGNYQGTYQVIAKRLAKEEESLGWIKSIVSDSEELPSHPGMSNKEALELLDLMAEISSERLKELQRVLPKLDTLPMPDEMDSQIVIEQEAQQKWRNHQDSVLHGVSMPDLQADNTSLQNLIRLLEEALVKNSELETHILSFTNKLAADVRSEQDQPWWVLLEQTQQRLEAIEKYPEEIVDLTISGNDQVDLVTLRGDSRLLLEHIQAGGKLKKWFRYTQQVRPWSYIIDQIKVGGKIPDCEAVLEKLVAWADIQYNLFKLRGLWTGTVELLEGDLSRQRAAFRDFCEPLEIARDLYDVIKAARDMLARIPGTQPISWHHIEEVNTLKARLENELLHRQVSGYNQQLEQIQYLLVNAANEPDAHQIAHSLAESIRSRDSKAYRTDYRELESLYADRKRFERINDLVEKLHAVVPKLAEEIKSTTQRDQWRERLSLLEEAWCWLQTDRWVERAMDPSYMKELTGKRERLGLKASETMTHLSAAKAWVLCLDRMTNSQETYLKGWMQAIRRIGAGTGKRAVRYRRIARSHLDNCRSAIPAWVMPLYRVVQTVMPGEDLFDVAIIDEASQSGMEALFLYYIAKKVLVVGDDKQIAPDYVGLNRDSIEHLRARHIQDIPLTDHYDLENSFFDQAFLRFGSRIRLTEHFRCMPEIIQFSNNLCYFNEPLIPLRQYGGQRLEPVITEYIPEGYTKGQSGNVVNPAEASAIIDQIEKCSQDPLYEGKTMGVISLLGKHQARLIEAGLLERIGPEEIQKRRIVCGDAYAFQGDERRVIFMSLVTASDRRLTALTGSRYERRFNVAASRAQDQMWLFHSVTMDDLSPRCLRRRLLSYCMHPLLEQEEVEGIDTDEIWRLARDSDRHDDPPDPFDSWFEIDVFLMIHNRGYRVIPQYQIAGYKIDLVVTGIKGRIAVECDGEEFHGADRYEADMARQRMLERCGLSFWRIRGGEFYRDPETSLEPLWQFLKKYGIAPMDQETESLETDLQQRGKAESKVGYEDTLPDNTNEPEWTPRRGVEDDESFFEEDKEDATIDSCESSDVKTEHRDSTSQGALLIDKMPSCPDPRTGDPREIRDGLIHIVSQHGPMPCHYAYELYRQACRAGRLSKAMRKNLNRAIRAAIKKGDIVQANEYGSNDLSTQIVRISDSPNMILRNRGERRLDQIPPSEIAAVMIEITKREHAIGRLNEEYLFRKVLDHYELIRLTEKAKTILTVAYDIYKRLV